jgi:hypothetical protein
MSHTMTAPTGLYPSLDRKRLIREAAAGRVRRTTSGYDLWERRGAAKPARIDNRVTELADAHWLALHDDGLWRPTQAGAGVAGIAHTDTPHPIVAHQRTPRPCAIDSCPDPWFAGDWCQRHYARWTRCGDPAGRLRLYRPLPELTVTTTKGNA